MRLAKGCTVKDVPMTMRRSHFLKSVAVSSWKRSGRDSPKKTMSGFTNWLHSEQVGITSAKIWSRKKKKQRN